MINKIVEPVWKQGQHLRIFFKNDFFFFFSPSLTELLCFWLHCNKNRYLYIIALVPFLLKTQKICLVNSFHLIYHQIGHVWF